MDDHPALLIHGVIFVSDLYNDSLHRDKLGKLVQALDSISIETVPGNKKLLPVFRIDAHMNHWLILNEPSAQRSPKTLCTTMAPSTTKTCSYDFIIDAPGPYSIDPVNKFHKGV